MDRQPRITVVGGGFAGLTAAITAAEAGARVTLHEAHHTLGGRGRTADGPYRTNEGPHALYRRGPHWTWLKRRGLLGPLAPLPLREAARLRFHRHGTLRRTPPPGLWRLSRVAPERAPVDLDFATWATAQAGPVAARDAAHYSGVVTFHHDPGTLSARFVQARLHRAAAVPPEASYPRGGWGAVLERMAAHAWNLGVRIEVGSRVDALPDAPGGPVIVATSLDAAHPLLQDPSLTWGSGRTVLLDLALRTRAGDPFAVSDLDAPAWLERFTAQDPTLAPAGQQLLQGQFPVAPGQSKAARPSSAATASSSPGTRSRRRACWWRWRSTAASRRRRWRSGRCRAGRRRRPPALTSSALDVERCPESQPGTGQE
ncbi:hypothetical protein GCM10023237_36810 [Streptomyces coeruleoprunus]